MCTERMLPPPPVVCSLYRCIVTVKAMPRARDTSRNTLRHVCSVRAALSPAVLDRSALARAAIGYLLWLSHKLPTGLTAPLLRGIEGDSTIYRGM